MKKLNYKAFVCKEQHYYIYGASVFLQCVKWGLKPTDNLLDIGCGSLRVGKHLIPFLDDGKYCGVEPEQKYLNDGLKWTDPAKRIRVEVDLDQWIGKRASSGRTVPRGFPKQNKFN